MDRIRYLFGSGPFLSTLDRSMRRVCSHGIGFVKVSKASVSTGAEYTFTNFTLAADDNQFIRSDKSSSWTHNALPPLLKINNRL